MDLRPLGFGEVLDAAFTIFRSRFWYFVLAQAIGTVPVTVISGLFLQVSARLTPAAALSQEMGRWPWYLLIVLLGLLQTGAVVSTAQQAYFDGEVSLGAAYRRAATRFPFFVLATIVAGVAIAAGLVLLVIPGIVIAVWFSQLPFLTVLEGESPLNALRDSLRLVRGMFWRVVGITLIAEIVVLVVSVLIELPLQGGTFGTQFDVTLPIARMIVQTLIGAFPLVALFVEYVDLRVRRGGFGTDAAGA